MPAERHRGTATQLRRHSILRLVKAELPSGMKLWWWRRVRFGVSARCRYVIWAPHGRCVMPDKRHVQLFGRPWRAKCASGRVQIRRAVMEIWLEIRRFGPFVPSVDEDKRLAEGRLLRRTVDERAQPALVGGGGRAVQCHPGA